MKHLLVLLLLLLLLLLFGSAFSQRIYRLCAPETISDSTCNSLSRGDSQVVCARVTDSADCAIKMSENKADFGTFNAEELLLAYQFYPQIILPIAQLRHEDSIKDDFEFRTVAVVPASFNSNEGLEGLRNRGFCHPGFSESQIWNDYILKYFERKVHGHNCHNGTSVSENEALNMKTFFGKACRPGDWVSGNKTYDKTLKNKYPELCELCDNQAECKYDDSMHHGHRGALKCLFKGRGNVAYVAYHYVIEYFGLNSVNPMNESEQFRFLCSDGSLQPLTKSNPCTWIQQPWSVIASRLEEGSEIEDKLKSWLVVANEKAESWTKSLKQIILKNTKINYFSELPTLRQYLVSGREVDLPDKSCGKTIRWCTVNDSETKKCNWMAKEARLLGIEPAFSCNMSNSTFDCLHNISMNHADIITIDSNYGYLARKLYNLTTVLYTETEKDKNSAVMAVILDNSRSISNFADLRDKTVCFPDYGGIAWLSFINTMRNNKLIKDTCDYPTTVSQLLSAACTPGINHIAHSDAHSNVDAINILCSACPLEKSNSTCSADNNNQFYGDKGALKCLLGPGDIAFIEAKNVNGHIRGKMINPNDFRVLCRNASLAQYTGFNVDDNCALSVTIDSEVVGRRNNGDIDTIDMTLALLKIEDWLGYRAYSRRAIRIYDSFVGSEDLLFKDSTIGLESIDSEVKSILAYKELFRFVEACTSNAKQIINNYIFIFILAVVQFFFYRI